MDYSLLVGIHDTEHVDSSGPEDEQDGEEEMETGEESGDGLDEPPSPDEIDGRPDFRRTESVSSNDGYHSELYAIPCSDGRCKYTVSLKERKLLNDEFSGTIRKIKIAK